jgi:hypothetical protein
MNSLDPEMSAFKFVDRQNEERTISMSAARIPDARIVQVSLMELPKTKRPGWI